MRDKMSSMTSVRIWTWPRSPSSSTSFRSPTTRRMSLRVATLVALSKKRTNCSSASRHTFTRLSGANAVLMVSSSSLLSLVSTACLSEILEKNLLNARDAFYTEETTGEKPRDAAMELDIFGVTSCRRVVWTRLTVVSLDLR